MIKFCGIVLEREADRKETETREEVKEEDTSETTEAKSDLTNSKSGEFS